MGEFKKPEYLFRFITTNLSNLSIDIVVSIVVKFAVIKPLKPLPENSGLRGS